MAIIKKMRQKLKDWWRHMAESKKWCKIPRGSERQLEDRPFARGDNWRRKDKLQKNHDNHDHKLHKDK